MADRDYGNDLKNLGQQLGKSLGRLGAEAREKWKELEPKVKEGAEQAGSAAGEAFKKLGASLRKLPERFRDGAGQDDRGDT